MNPNHTNKLTFPLTIAIWRLKKAANSQVCRPKNSWRLWRHLPSVLRVIWRSFLETLLYALKHVAGKLFWIARLKAKRRQKQCDTGLILVKSKCFTQNTRKPKRLKKRQYCLFWGDPTLRMRVLSRWESPVLYMVKRLSVNTVEPALTKGRWTCWKDKTKFTLLSAIVGI